MRTLTDTLKALVKIKSREHTGDKYTCIACVGQEDSKVTERFLVSSDGRVLVGVPSSALQPGKGFDKELVRTLLHSPIENILHNIRKCSCEGFDRFVFWKKEEHHPLACYDLRLVKLLVDTLLSLGAGTIRLYSDGHEAPFRTAYFTAHEGDVETVDGALAAKGAVCAIRWTEAK
jgi:hypothetical protein